MNNVRSSALVSILLLVFCIVPAAVFAQPETEHQKPWKVLHLFERSEGDLAFIDTGAPGPSIGDRLVFSNPIFDTEGNRVGRDGADCLIVRIDASAPPDRQQVVQCTISVQFAEGQITVQGLAQGTDNVFAITGGTGAYREAKGEVRAVDITPLVEAEITIWLFR